MAKKRASRRQEGSATGKTENLLVRLGLTEKQAFAEAADLAGIPLSAWVRERLRWAAVKELQAADRQVPFLRNRGLDEEAGADGSNG